MSRVTDYGVNPWVGVSMTTGVSFGEEISGVIRTSLKIYAHKVEIRTNGVFGYAELKRRDLFIDLILWHLAYLAILLFSVCDGSSGNQHI